MIALLLAETPPLVSQSGQATAIGVWVLMAIAVGAAGLFIYNQILTAQINRKALNAPPPPAPLAPQMNPQPFIVELKKQFVERPDYDRDRTDLKNQVVEARSYAHNRVHELAEIVNAERIGANERNERLAKLEADSVVHTGQLGEITRRIERGNEGLHTRINEVLKAVSRVEGQIAK